MAMNAPNIQGASQFVAPTVTIPPGLSDVTNIAVYRERVVKRKFEEPLTISDDDVANVVLAEHAVVQTVGGAQVTPPWFGPALATALAPLQADIATIKTDVATLKTDVATLKTDVATLKTDVATVNRAIDNIAARSENALSVADTDPLQPVMVGFFPPPDFPIDIAALKNLSGASLNNLETYYRLPHDQTEGKRRYRLAKKLGIHVPLLRHLATAEEAL